MTRQHLQHALDHYRTHLDEALEILEMSLDDLPEGADPDTMYELVGTFLEETAQLRDEFDHTLTRIVQQGRDQAEEREREREAEDLITQVESDLGW